MIVPQSGQPIAKPEPLRRTKARKDRAEAKEEKRVRAIVAERDGFCRVARLTPTDCGGFSEWAHLAPKRRSQTRGMAPEVRHTTTHTAMLCTVHHQQYDAREFVLQFMTARGADGPLAALDPSCVSCVSETSV